MEWQLSILESSVKGNLSNEGEEWSSGGYEDNENKKNTVDKVHRKAGRSMQATESISGDTIRFRAYSTWLCIKELSVAFL